MTNSNEIIIYGKTYKIKADASTVKPQKLADYVNDKMHELSSGKTKPSTIDLAILTALNIAGELFELKETIANEEVQQKTGRKEVDQKANHLVQMVEKELSQIQSSEGADR